MYREHPDPVPYCRRRILDTLQVLPQLLSFHYNPCNTIREYGVPTTTDAICTNPLYFPSSRNISFPIFSGLFLLFLLLRRGLPVRPAPSLIQTTASKSSVLLWCCTLNKS